MEWTIHPIQPRSLPGWYALVQLTFHDHEHSIIFKNKCRGLDIVGDIKFADVYDAANHSALLPSDSSTQVDIFINMLDHGLQQVDQLIKRAARTTPRVAPIPPQPFNFFDSARFEHTWIKGEQGWGKTSLLSALIAQDLLRVRDGECSLLIIDSQDEHLGKYLPHMADFAPGGELHGKLVYLEPDIERTHTTKTA